MFHQKAFLVPLVLLLFAQSTSARLCDQTWQSFQNKMRLPENRLSFANFGGPFDIGVCWWHSRMQRNANYLWDFRPRAARMTEDETWEAIKASSDTSRVVAINGYANLQDFSTAHKEKMSEYLGQWQMTESFFEFNWINGLLGSSEETAQTYKEMMDALFEQVATKKEIVYQILQRPGLAAHSWLVYDMRRTRIGYDLTVADSNFPTLQWKYTYSNGDTTMRGQYGNWVPYMQRDSDLTALRGAVASTCESWSKQTRMTPR